MFKLSGFANRLDGDGKEKELRMTLRFGAWAVGRMELSFTEVNVLGEQV